MISLAIRHLFESTLVCVVLIGVGAAWRKTANARYAVWLAAAAKFAIPSAALAVTGAQLAFFWPAAPWLSSLVNSVSAVLTAVEGWLPGESVGGDMALTPVLVVSWLIGAVAMAGCWGVRLTRSKRDLMVATDCEQEAMSRARGLLQVRQRVELRLSEREQEPALRGVWRPIVSVPRGLSEKLSAAEFESVLLHELAHARRFDNLAAIFVHCLVCVFWFHPLLWLLERRLNVERERACDELVLACGTKPAVYASGIVNVCRFHLFGAVGGISAAGVSTMTASDLKQRLELILEFPRANGKSPYYAPRLMIAAIAIFITVAPIAGGYCNQCVSNGQQPVAGHLVSHSK